ncbi:hypothetical protein [Allomuricauda sp. d1]|uniref:hypothetical protein n=1 Tax=Allomuricauda sp. d1 TaxID=3136725 RepID=UPI0031CDED56
MGELIEVVDSLENKISKLLHKMELLHRANSKLQSDLATMQQENDDFKTAVTKWEEKYNSLKMANTMLGGNTNKTEAKLKINALIRDIDHCIAQLAE